MKKIFYMLVISCLSLVGCSNGAIKSVEVTVDEGLKSDTTDNVTYVLENMITMKDTHESIVEDKEGYIYDHAKEIAAYGNIEKYNQVFSGIKSSDDIYIGEYKFKNDNGTIEYEFRFEDDSSIYNKLAP